MTQYRIEIDRSLCSGFGSCARLAPDLIEARRVRDRVPAGRRHRRPDRPGGGRSVPDGRNHCRGVADGMSGILIVGAGLAGTRCAEALRAGGYDGPLTLVGEEDHPTVRAPRLEQGAAARGAGARRSTPEAAGIVGRTWNRARHSAAAWMRWSSSIGARGREGVPSATTRSSSPRERALAPSRAR